VFALLAAAGAAAPPEPALQRDPLPFDALMSWTAVDPLQVRIDAAVAGQGDPECFTTGATQPGCLATIGELVRQRSGALGLTANYSDGLHTLGLAVIDHHAYAAANSHTTTLCVGDAPAPGQRPPVSIGKDADATRCRTAVSGERVVAGGVPAIEGLADDGKTGAFWWSVQHFRRVERTLVGLRADGTVLVAVATSQRDGVRNGMTIPAAAAWLIAHGVRDAIALDGGHQAAIWSAQHGSETPLERGEPTLQMALLLGPVLPPPPAAAAPAALPAPAAAPAALAHPRLQADLRRVDGVLLQSGDATRALRVHVGAPALPETGLPGSASVHLRSEIDGDEPVDLDSRWLTAARVGHRLPDLDPPPGDPALPETGVVGSTGGPQRAPVWRWVRLR